MVAAGKKADKEDGSADTDLEQGSPGLEEGDSFEDSGERAAEEDEEGYIADALQNGNEGNDAGVATGDDIDTSAFSELHLDERCIQATNDAWRLFLTACESREAAGEVIYAALFESVPGSQHLFVTPRAVHAMKFLTSFNSFVTNLDDPPRLKILVETEGFGETFGLWVTKPRVAVFRDSILDIFSVELGDKFTPLAREGWTKVLNYVGGAIIYVKTNYADRISTLLESWEIATSGKQSNAKALQDSQEQASAEVANNAADEKLNAQGNGTKKGWMASKKAETKGDLTEVEAVGKGQSEQDKGMMDVNQVPTTYIEMFRFNSAVMGFGTAQWMGEVLECFDTIVRNISNPTRFQEECDVLVLRISKVSTGAINFGQYKSCMLASLRSLLPKDWSTQHEVAWSWLWENVERTVSQNLGNPKKWYQALLKVMASLDDNQKFEMRKDVYARFFAVAPAGQDHFKQSNTYLHYILERVWEMTLELYHTPVKLVDDVSALGLRHVGYAIPVEFFGPFVSSCVEVLMAVTDNRDCVESFRWSLGLIAKMLVRTITEGSTIVMKAINVNSAKQLNKAVACAPRGERAKWMLVIQVGTQRISPLAWSIQSGALDALTAIVQDLLTIRADRDRYYYGMDDLFERHPDIVQRLTNEAPSVLPTLLDGLIWRSRTTENGLRRCNYYIRHLLIDVHGKFSPTLSWVAKANDPGLVCHPILALLSDTVWSGVAQQTFLFRKSWFLFTLLIFIAGQSILKHANDDDDGSNTAKEHRILVFAFRLFIYTFSMTQLIWSHLSKCIKQLRQKRLYRIFGTIPIPAYLRSWQDAAGFCLMIMLIMMLVFEPILWCLGQEGFQGFDSNDIFTEDCKGGRQIEMAYSIFSVLAMILYYILLIDLAVLSTKVSAYVLVCIRMFSEFFLFLLALCGTLLTFASAISVLRHEQADFMGIHKGLLALMEMAMRMKEGKQYEKYETDPLVCICVFFFLIVVMIFLLNMLVAQLTCAYEAVYLDMIGYARLERIEIIVGTMPLVPEKRWRSFCDSLRLDEKCEFNAGDVGVKGGLQIVEAANLNPTTVDAIRRFGGSTSVENPWPAEEGAGEGDDRFERLESLIQKTVKRMTKNITKGKRAKADSGHSESISEEGATKEDASGSSEAEGDSP